MKTLTYKRLDRKSEVTTEIKSIKTYSTTEMDITLIDEKVICVSKFRSEIYGKNGNYLSIIENLNINQ